MLLVWWQEGHPTCKKTTEWWDAGVVVCRGQGADLHMAQLMPLPLAVSCSGKSRLVLPFWCRLTQVVPNKGPLNGCMYVIQNETVLELAGRSRSMWVLGRIKSAAIGRGLDKTASLFQRTVNNPVRFAFLSLEYWCRRASF